MPDNDNTDQTEQPEAHDTTPQPAPVPYSRFQEVNKKYRDLQRQVDAMQADNDQAERDAKLAAVQSEIAKLQRTILQRDVATKTGLPAELASRLVGETEEALLADATALLKVVRKAGNTGIPVTVPTEKLHDLAWYSRNRDRVQRAVSDGQLK